MKTVSVIGAGISGIAAATYLAKYGFKVAVYEKHAAPGGRARQLKKEGFIFDMGPSFYWMPDVYEKYFSAFGKKPSDYYELLRLDPGYRVFFSESDYIDVHADLEKNFENFEAIEKGAGVRLRKYLDKAGSNYRTSMGKIVRVPGLSPLQYVRPGIMRDLLRLNLLGSVSGSIRKTFKDKRLVQLLEFPMLFLGGLPGNIPALYSLMNHADIVMGTWYPQGGMVRIVDGMVELAESMGVSFHYEAEVDRIGIEKGKVHDFRAGGNTIETDILLASADYQHVEQNILPDKARTYSRAYWNNRTLAPAAMMFYIGIKKKLPRLLHHNLFFDVDFDAHADTIYNVPRWPEDPVLYIACTSKTDPDVAPTGHENLAVLLPLAPGLEDTSELREKYYDYTINKLEKFTGENIREHVSTKNIYGHSDFIKDYHSYKGNAYGLANTMMQTAFLKPRMKSRKVSNLYFAGQLTVPGPGVPPALISGEIAGGVLARKYQTGIR